MSGLESPCGTCGSDGYTDMRKGMDGLGRKNHLFAGSDGGADRWAAISTLTTTAKLNDVEPQAWITDILQRMTDGHPINHVDELLPWNWQPSAH